MKNIFRIVLCLLAIIIVSLVCATVIEKNTSYDYVVKYLYSATWMIMLWCVFAMLSLFAMFRLHLWRRPKVFVLHIALATILAGALITHLTSKSGVLYLHKGETSNFYVTTDNNIIEALPFNVRLDCFSIRYYNGTNTPSDYESRLSFVSSSESQTAIVSMNKVCTYGGYRFFQSAYDEDLQGSTLLISKDPWGTGITYVGYGLLFLAMLFVLFDKNSQFRVALRNTKKSFCVLLFLLPISASSYELRSVSPKVADEYGRLLVLYQGRICPMNTLAVDLCRKLYGSNSYRGYSANMVLCGWLFYLTSWREDLVVRPDNTKDQQKILLIEALSGGSLLEIFPYVESDGTVKWLSRADCLSEELPAEERCYIRETHDYLRRLIINGHDDKAQHTLKRLKSYQIERAGNHTPSEFKQKTEILYNKITHTRLAAILSLCIGVLCMVVEIFVTRRTALRLIIFRLSLIFAILTGAYLLALFTMRWIALGSIPLTCGYEAMQLLALLTLFSTLVVLKRIALLLPGGLFIAGFALLVALLGESDPPIVSVMPVLSSPLLSLHVLTIMIAYALLAILFIVSVFALIQILRIRMLMSVDYKENIERLTNVSRLFLTPAVFMLSIGIFTGAVWANVSWGSYWQWDPKETWALITLLVYIIPLHNIFLKKHEVLGYHVFIAMAFVCVLITYFGVNYFLGGMHSYA